MNVKEFLNIVCEALEIEDGSINVKDSMDTIEQWDSLAHLSLLAMLDSMGINTDEKDVQELDSIEKLVNLARKNGIIED